MKTTRREFIRLSAGAISVSCLLPGRVLARGQEMSPVNPNRRILVVVQLSGGNDGLNTIIPYKDSRYHQLRPNLGFREEELKDTDGNSTIINSEFGFHPALKELKGLYTQGRLAVVLGIGYPDMNLSHEISTKIWQSANTNQGFGTGWLGRYADMVFDDQADLPAVAIGAFSRPDIVSSKRVNIPLIASLGGTAFEANGYPLLRENIINTFRDLNERSFLPGSFIESVAKVGAKAEKNSGLLESVLDNYSSSVIYPEDNTAAQALKSVAVLASAFPEADVFHVSYPSFFDTHANQIGTPEDQFRNKRVGAHAIDLKRLSQAIKPFHDDMEEHGLGENYVLMTYSEFGRRPDENASNGTDHGSVSNLFVVGNRVKGGDIYGLQPSLKASDFDTAGNMPVTTDFRSVYATLIDKWLPDGDSKAILGEQFPHLGFL